MDSRDAAHDMVLLNAAVCDVPPDAGAAVREALRANSGFKDTKGATLSIDPDTNRFELSQYARLEDLTVDRFVAMIEEFATALVSVRERLDGASLDRNPAEVAEALNLGEFMRV